jgi:hypothetical protein
MAATPDAFIADARIAAYAQGPSNFPKGCRVAEEDVEDKKLIGTVPTEKVFIEQEKERRRQQEETEQQKRRQK